MDPLDVVVLTKNSERVLDQCLRSIFENIPVHRLLVVDASSVDETLKIVAKYNKAYGNVRVINENGSRARARERGIQEVETDWFAFVDSDVILCKDWFKTASRYIQSDVGAIWGVDVPANVKSQFLKRALQWMEARVFAIRGGCHDIIIRREAVRDIKIPTELHTLEDAYIKQWILSKNYRVLMTYSSYCTHCKTVNELFSKENAASTIRELKQIRLVRERLVFGGFFAFVWFLHQIESRASERR